MRTSRSIAAAALAAAALLLPVPDPARAVADGGTRRESPGRTQPCPDGIGDAVPGAVSVRGVTDSGPVTLTVLVLVDGIPMREAQLITSRVQAAYRPLAIDVRPTYRRVSFDAEGRAGDGQAAARPTTLIDEARAVHATMATDFDVVHVLTGKDVAFDSDNDGSDSLGGMAACVGGIRYDGQEFSVSEARYRWYVPAPDDLRVVIMAHEIAHLLGAHHHYGNCTEGRTAFGHGWCTVMMTIGYRNSVVFGTLESAVVRGYAVSYA